MERMHVLVNKYVIALAIRRKSKGKTIPRYDPAKNKVKFLFTKVSNF